MSKIYENTLVDKSSDIVSKEIIKESTYNINAITGDENHLYNHLKKSIKNAVAIDIIVSFLMESGVKLIIDDLKEAIDREVKIRILTGNYLGITQPWALRLLKSELKDKVDLRFYNVKNRSFHPKAYMFHTKLDSEIYIGSSNISYGALTNSIEWNYRFKKSSNIKDYEHFYNTFEDLFNNHSIIIDDNVLEEYSKSWKRPKVYKDMEKLEEDKRVINLFEPRGAQIEALHKLKQSREEGFDKGLVVAATGIGKTYLAAFDSREYKRVLFLAHREEIIKQAQNSFKNVRPNDSVGFFYGNEKDADKNLIFALVQTLGKDEYLNEDVFKRDYFDYIVVDEFHHAVANNYRKIIEYFTPKFLLGLTATPERLDSKDVFELCDYNIAYEIRLQEAINKGLLCPFRYYGIYDDTVKYEEIEFKNGKYNDKALEEALMLNNRGNLILKHYKKYKSKRAMGFCTSKKHAEFMAKYFQENGVKAVAVYSGASGKFNIDREEAINALNKEEIQVIFSVDMFNEGLDIPGIDMVMFLRPTESPTIFLQQLGRGLRKTKDKEYLNVLDFIGNYKKANLIPFLLSGKNYNRIEAKKGELQNIEFPEDCLVDFDFRLVDIFKTLAEKEMGIKEKIKEQYLIVKEELKHIPSRVELFTYMDDEVYQNIRSNPKVNPFKDYIKFLEENNDLVEEEKELFNIKENNIHNNSIVNLDNEMQDLDSYNVGKEFINMIETTSMSKTYKMPVLLAFYNEGNIKMEITEEDIYKSFYEFYNKGSNKVDMLKDKSTKDFETWDKNKYISLAKRNPIKFLLKTHGEFFIEKEGVVLALKEEIQEVIKIESFKKHMKDAIELRVKEYYKNRNFKI